MITRYLILFVLLCAGCFCFAAGKNGSAENETIPDYSECFAKLHKFGLPDVSKAGYGRLTGNATSAFGVGPVLSGNAWLLSGDHKSKAKFLVDNYIILDIVPKPENDYINQVDKAGVTSPTDRDYDRQADFKPGDYKKDYDNIIKILTSSYYRDDFCIHKAGTFMDRNYDVESLLLFAALIHDKGMKNEANMLAHMIFSHRLGREYFMNLAIELLVDAKLKMAYFHFMRDHDWKKYSQNIDAILKLVPKGWGKQSGVEYLSRLIKARIANDIKDVNGANLSAADRKFARELADAKTISGLSGYERIMYHPFANSSYPPRDDVWFMPKNQKSKPVGDKSDIATEAIVSRGLQSIPLLAALLDDDTLTYVSGNSGYSYYENRQDVGDFGAVPHPATRGEISLNLALDIVTVEKEVFLKFGRKKKIRTLLNLYDELKNLNREQVIEYYVKNGRQRQQDFFAEIFLNPGPIKRSSVMEAYFLSNPQYDGNRMVVLYVDRTAPVSKKFADEYIKTVKEAIENNSIKNEYSSEKESKKDKLAQLTKLERKFNDIFSSETAQEIVDQYLSGKREWNDSSSSILAAKTEQMSYVDTSKFILEAILKAKENKNKINLLAFLLDMNICCKGNDSLTYEELAARFSANKLLWMQLFEGNDKDGKYFEFRDSLLWIFYQRCHFIKRAIMFPEDGQYGSYLSEPRCAKIMEKDIYAFVNGQKFPVPLSGNIPAEKLKELGSMLINSDDAKLPAIIKKLSDEELFSVGKSLDTDKKLNRKLLVTANRIVKVEFETLRHKGKECIKLPMQMTLENKPVFDTFANIKGVLSEELIVDVFNGIKKLVENDIYVDVSFNREKELGGVVVKIGRRDFYSKLRRRLKRFPQIKVVRSIAGYLSWNNQSEWILKNGSDRSIWLAEDEEKQKKFWSDVKLEINSNALTHIYFSLHSNQQELRPY